MLILTACDSPTTNTGGGTSGNGGNKQPTAKTPDKPPVVKTKNPKVTRVDNAPVFGSSSRITYYKINTADADVPLEHTVIAKNITGSVRYNITQVGTTGQVGYIPDSVKNNIKPKTAEPNKLNIPKGTTGFFKVQVISAADPAKKSNAVLIAAGRIAVPAAAITMQSTASTADLKVDSVNKEVGFTRRSGTLTGFTIAAELDAGKFAAGVPKYTEFIYSAAGIGADKLASAVNSTTGQVTLGSAVDRAAVQVKVSGRANGPYAELSAQTLYTLRYFGWTQIASGNFHVLAINDAGELYAWGHNNVGQLGNGENGPGFPGGFLQNSKDKNTPQRIGSGTDWNIVAAGNYHSLALKNDGTLYTWGHNSSGQLGNGLTADTNRPAQVGTDTWKAVAAGENYSLALRSDGSLYAWGANGNGRLGDGTTVRRTTPTQIGTDVWKAVAAGDKHSLAIKNDGSLHAWGNNSDGQLAVVTTTSQLITPTQIGTDTDWTAVAGGRFHSLALKSGGTLHAWGSNSLSQLGRPAATAAQRITPGQIGTDTDWKALAGGQQYSLAIKSDGRLYGWGSNANGQLGINSTTGKPRPSPAAGTGWDKVIGSRASSYSLAIKSDGTLYSWGINTNGQLGDGTNTQRLVPTIVPHP